MTWLAAVAVLLAGVLAGAYITAAVLLRDVGEAVERLQATQQRLVAALRAGRVDPARETQRAQLTRIVRDADRDEWTGR